MPTLPVSEEEPRSAVVETIRHYAEATVAAVSGNDTMPAGRVTLLLAAVAAISSLAPDPWGWLAVAGAVLIARAGGKR